MYNLLLSIFGIILVLIGAGVAGWFKILKETNCLLKEQNSELRCQYEEFRAKYLETARQVASLQGQIDILKSIPLQSISRTLEEIAKFLGIKGEVNV